MPEIRVSDASENALNLEERSRDMVRFGANAATIKNLFGCVPKLAQNELTRVGNDFRKSRMGKDASFLHQVPEAFPIANKLWTFYSILTNDPKVEKPLEENIDKMLDAYARVYDESEDEIRNYVNFNRFVQLLHRIGSGAVATYTCECGTKFIAHVERPGHGCPHCRLLKSKKRQKK